jgi:hypothetical protein
MSTTFRKTSAVTWAKDPSTIAVRNVKAVAFASDLGVTLRNIQGYAFETVPPGAAVRNIQGYAFESVKLPLPLNVAGNLALYALINTLTIAATPWSTSNSTLGVPSALSTPLAGGQNTTVSLTAQTSSGYSGSMNFSYTRRNLSDAFPNPISITPPSSATTVWALLSMINSAYSVNLTTADVVNNPVAAGALSVNLVAAASSWMFIPGTTALVGNPPTLASIITEPNLPGFQSAAGAGPGYPYKQTTLQMHFEGTGAAAIATDTYGHPMTTAGSFGTNSSFTAKFGSGSSGSPAAGAYARTVDKGDLRLGADLTIEFWVYTTAPTTSTGTSISKGSSLTKSSIQIVNANLVVNTDQTSALISTPHGLASSVWTHIAIVKASGVWAVYVGGVQKATFASTDTFGVNASPLTIQNSFDGTQPGASFMDELRISNGVARYTASFTPFTYQFGDIAPLSIDGYPTSNTTLLMHFDGPDTSTVITEALGHTVVNTGASLTAYQSAFGPTSLAPVGSSANSVAIGPGTGHDLQLTDNFTIECWVYNQNSAQNGVVFSKDVSASVAAQLKYANGTWQVYADQSTAIISVAVAPASVLNVWQHVAVVKRKGTYTLYVNGVALASAPSTSTTFGNNAGSFEVGNSAATSLNFQGLIDELRISKVARYGSNFTPPTQAFALGTADLMTMAQAFNGNTGSLSSPTSATTILSQLSTWNTVSGVNLVSTDLVDGPIAAGATSVTLTAASTSLSLVPGSQVTLPLTVTSLLMHFDGTTPAQVATDVYGHAFTVAGVAGTHSTDTAKFGQSYWCNQSGSYISTPDASNLELNGDFTIEFWLYYAGTTGTLMQKGNASIGMAGFTVVGDSGATIINLTAAAFGWQTSTWQNVTLVKKGTTWTVYNNGVAMTSVTSSDTWGVNSSPLVLGNTAAGTSPMVAYMDELRISKGARYTANFTPFQSPFIS